MSRRGTTPNPLPLGPFASSFAQFTTQSQPVQQQPKPRPATLAPRASPLARSPSGFSPANALSVEEWETKAPLNDLQIRSVAAVKKAGENKRIPEKFDTANSERDSPSRPSTPLTKRLLASAVTPGTPGSTSRPGTPSSRLGPATHKLLPKHPLYTPQQFYDWHALISRSVTHAQEAHFRAHLDSVSSHIETCDFLISQIDLVKEEFTSMHSQWQGVEDGGRNLKESSEGLLIERDMILRLENELGERLDYFKELEYATRMLNSPVLESSGGKGSRPLVMESEFLDMIERVVICIQWLEAHRHYREAEIYLLRFHQCLTRAMTLVKMYFVGSLRAVQTDVARRFGDKVASSSEQTTHHLLYTRFRALISPPSMAYGSTTPTQVPSSLRPLLHELEYRARSYPSELGALLGECHTAYLATRKALVGPVVRAEVESLVKGIHLASGPGGTGDVVELTRAGCSYLKQLCTEEFDLFKEFFTTGEDLLYNYLETLCDYLYDDLRPRILHEPRLGALCEICTVLQALMVLDVQIDDDGESGNDSALVDGGHGLDLILDSTLRTPDPNSQALGHSKPRLHISQLLQMILQDAQTRLFFKAQAVVQSDIRHYVAKSDDLAYPAKLLNAVGMRDSSYEKDNFSGVWSRQPVSDKDQGASLENQHTWFPTLRKTVLVLEQLHEFVNPAIFEDIAEEAIVLCQASLVAASENIVNSLPPSLNRPSSSPEPENSTSESVARSTLLDGHLFLIRHLLILREVPARFGLGSDSSDNLVNANTNRTSSWDGTKTQKISASGSVTDTLASLLGGASAALATLGVLPSDYDNMASKSDSKRTIDNAKRSINQSLRSACENTIATCTNDICEPLRMWVERVGAFSAASAFSRNDLRPSSSASSNLSASSSNQSVGPKDVKGLPDWASPSSASEVDHNFKMACEQKLLLAVRKIRLYMGGVQSLEEELKSNTDESSHDGDKPPVSSPNIPARALANVLVQHIEERIGEEYAWFRDVIWGMSTDANAPDKTGAANMYTEDQLRELKELRERILDSRTLKAMLKGIAEGQ
ncbi:Sec34-like family-domain-containing protein [Lentinula raphanica]|uniref:Conserved oligomeric Golgi complex subunit 3 n=1 Tax=Lentinula raphanica TaxID=153919 RepID=A0AA38PL40_9AGAR|nr:Sec34-like family-domain-containing protein [Lentinula raphanica]KAJ3844491.1 Sec34-like family-domain-containing protein [Lentinula raphanica]KAJ3971971.1 Sec34-like family-domain-containing protein [Lentinula raphanica]